MYELLNKLFRPLFRTLGQKQATLEDDPTFGKIGERVDKWVRSTCGYCGTGCGVYIGVRDGKPVITRGDPAQPVSKGTLCPKGATQHLYVNAENRVTAPLIRKNGTLEPVGWDEAFTLVSNKFKAVQDAYGKGAIGCLSTGQLLTEEFYALGKFVQLGLGTSNYDGNTSLCMSSAVAGYKQTFGSDGPPGCYEDFTYADVIILTGSNLAENHPILKLHIAKNESITGKKPTIIVMDPRMSKTAMMADIYVPLKPRTDLALMNGLCHIILEQGWEDEAFIKARTSGFAEFRHHVMEKYPPQQVAEITGLEVKMLYELARIYARAERALIAWTMGINQSSIGTDTVSAICNLALITGNLARPGASPFSITGQCNAMGSREFSFTSAIPGYRNYAYEKDRIEYANLIGVSPEIIPSKRGYAYPQIVDAILAGEIKALWVVCTNPLVSFVDQNKLKKAFSMLDILVVQDAFMSETAEVADVVFAAGTWSEKEGCYTNGERRCNHARKAVEPIGICKSDLDIIIEFSTYFEGAYEMLFKNMNSPREVFEEIKKVSKGRLCDYSGMSYELIEELGGIQWPCNEQYPKGKQRLYDDRCQTEDGRAKLLALDYLPMKEDICTNYPLILNTGRTVEQFHTGTKTKTIKLLSDLTPEAWCELHPADAERLQVASGDRIRIASVRGSVEDLMVKVTGGVRQGTVFVPFHFSRQLINALTIDDFDKKSFEPNFKQCAVNIYSEKVPEGLTLAEKQVSGLLEQSKVRQVITLEQVKELEAVERR